MFGLFKKRKNIESFPQYWKDYLALFNEKVNLSIPISQAEFTVLDVESNGLDPKTDKILSIGAVKVIENQIRIEDSFEMFIDQNEYNPDAAPIHGILKTGNIEKVNEEQAIIELTKYLGKSIIVGHSIIFDISILNATLKHYLDDKFQNKTLDTVNIYKRLKAGDFKEGTSTSLDKLSDEFNIPKSDRHNAAGDALITAILLMKLSARLKERGIITLGDLLKQKRLL